MPTIRENALDDVIELIDTYNIFMPGIMSEFGGPSLYFHDECIKECRNKFLSNRHIELIYATLTSWGMHRMGPTKTKMTDFQTFQDSINRNKETLVNLQNVKLYEIEDGNLNGILTQQLMNVFFDLKVSVSNSILVANSKTLHHILPDLIPPIDRQYTIRFFYDDIENYFYNNGRFKTVNISEHPEIQFSMLVDIATLFRCFITEHLLPNHFVITDHNFDTSFNKVVDNLIVRYVKLARQNHHA